MLQYHQPAPQNGERGAGDKKEVSQGRTCVSSDVLTGHHGFVSAFSELDREGDSPVLLWYVERRRDGFCEEQNLPGSPCR